MPHPTVINLYWDGNWDGDHASAFSSGRQPTRDTIDSFTRDLANSPYFGKASQYNVQGFTFGGSFGSSDICGPLRAHRSVNSFTLDRWVNCMVSRRGTRVPEPSQGHKTDILYVVYLPTGTLIQNGGIYDACGTYVAYHSFTLVSDYVYAVVPLECQSSFDALTTSTTHEVIEAMTDPYLRGWWALGAEPPVTIPAPTPGLPDIQIPMVGEVADLCATATGFRFFTFNVEAYFSNSDNACAIGTESQATFTAPLTMQPSNATVQQQSTLQFVISPTVPVVFAIPTGAGSALDPATIRAGGLLYTGSGSGDYTISVVARATDGRATPSVTSTVRALAPVEVLPGFVNLPQLGRVEFSEKHHFNVLWMVVGANNGTIGSTSGQYIAPDITSPRYVTIRAVPPGGSQRSSGQATVRILPVFRAATDRSDIKAGSDVRLRLSPGVYGVCTKEDEAQCLRVYPDRPHIIIEISPPIGRMGNPNAHTTLLKQAEALTLQALYEKDPKLAQEAAGELAAVKSRLAENDTTYHAPTADELKQLIAKGGEGVDVVVTAFIIDPGNEQTVDVKLTLY